LHIWSEAALGRGRVPRAGWPVACAPRSFAGARTACPAGRPLGYDSTAACHRISSSIRRWVRPSFSCPAARRPLPAATAEPGSRRPVSGDEAASSIELVRGWFAVAPCPRGHVSPPARRNL